MALSALMAVFAAGNIMPAHTYAAESTVKQAPVHAVAKAYNDYEEYSLEIEGLKRCNGKNRFKCFSNGSVRFNNY